MILAQKVAVVTGAGQGIGYGVALALAQEGCQVAVLDVNQDTASHVAQELSSLGLKAIAITCDVSQKDSVDLAMATVGQSFPAIDIVVNNAGIYPFLPFANLTESDWDRVLDVNLKGNFLVTQAALKTMNPGGRIINISSIASLVGIASLSHYCASKAAINGLTRSLALELAPRGITVNAIAPGAIDTPGASGGSDEIRQKTIATIPLKRMGTPQDIAAAVVFLASPSASYLTGQVIAVDGGWTVQ